MRESRTLPYHRTDPNHRSIVSAIAVQTTLVTTRNSKPKPNIASARYSVPTVPPTPTHKAHAIRPMRLRFNWKRRLVRLQGGFGRDSIGGNTNYIFTFYIFAEAICNGTRAPRATYPVASGQGNQPSCGATTDVGGPGIDKAPGPFPQGERALPPVPAGTLPILVSEMSNFLGRPGVTSWLHGRQNQTFVAWSLAGFIRSFGGHDESRHSARPFSAYLPHQQPPALKFIQLNWTAATFSAAWGSAASTVPSTAPLLRINTMRKRRFIRLASLAGVSLGLGGGVAWPMEFRSRELRSRLR